MRVLQNLEVPTGNILVVEGEKGSLELVSLGDYGKDVNLKADFLGLERDPGEVKHQKMLSLEEKWVIAVSTQYGCSMGCTFCDVPKVGPGKNVSLLDMCKQIKAGRALHPEVEFTDRLNIHFARMGEPTWNGAVLGCAEFFLISEYGGFADTVHPVVSTMMPRNNRYLPAFLDRWLYIKNKVYNGEAGLQLSINSTNEAERVKMFNGNALYLADIAGLMNHLLYGERSFSVAPELKGRKITLNFAVTDDYTIDAKVLKRYFDPRFFLVKLTPMHRTLTAIENELEMSGDATSYAPYQEKEEALKAEGFDVIVFIASKEEDESLITCGNAVLSGAVPRTEYRSVL